MTEFFQDGPKLGNQYEEDDILRLYLKRVLPKTVLEKIEQGLSGLGERVATDILALGNSAEVNPPQHIPYDPWGRRIDEIKVCDAWRELERISSKEKLVATAYERQYGALSRIHQFARVYLFGPSSAYCTCPLAMTDGAARVIELYGDKDKKLQEVFRKLTASNPSEFWTSGQWMTERTGGSDVGATSTVARLKDGQYRIYGTKWFTSATTSQVAMTLARIEKSPAGNKELSLFLLELRDSSGGLKNIRINRLKDKLGTRALPTAELTMNGTPAYLVGGEGNGVRKISSILNITRIWNSCEAVSSMRRGIALARDYASKRQAFGKLLAEHPLHLETLASLEVQFRGAFYLTFRLAELLGKEELGEATHEESATLRILTPVVKLYTAKQCIAVVSEILECFGGAGYIEDTGLPRLLRNSQVLSIWEGTTNILSLDMLRAMQGKDAIKLFFDNIEGQIINAQEPELKPLVKDVRYACIKIRSYLNRLGNSSDEFLEAGARNLAYSFARIYGASLLIAQADWALKNEKGGRKAVTAAQRWLLNGLVSLPDTNDEWCRDSRNLAL